MRRPDSLVAQISGDMDPPYMCMCGVYVWGGGMGTTCKASVSTKSCFAIAKASSYRGYKLCATKNIAAIKHASSMPMHTRVA